MPPPAPTSWPPNRRTRSTLPPAPASRPVPPGNLRAWFSAMTAPPTSSHEVPCRRRCRYDHVEKERCFCRGGGDKGQEPRAVARDDRCDDPVPQISTIFLQGRWPPGVTNPARARRGPLLDWVVERDGVKGQPVAAVTENSFGHGRVVSEHGVIGHAFQGWFYGIILANVLGHTSRRRATAQRSCWTGQEIHVALFGWLAKDRIPSSSSAPRGR